MSMRGSATQTDHGDVITLLICHTTRLLDLGCESGDEFHCTADARNVRKIATRQGQAGGGCVLLGISVRARPDFEKQKAKTYCTLW